jgi:hypothetical protein
MAADRIPPTLMEVCMRIPHFFEQLVYVECDDASRTAFALTCRPIYDTLMAIPNPDRYDVPHVAPILTRRNNRNALNPQIELLLTALEPEYLPRLMAFCHLCGKIHSPMRPLEQMRDASIPYARRMKCARWESLPTIYGQAGMFPAEFNTLMLYCVYKAKAMVNWQPIELERQLDVTIAPFAWTLPHLPFGYPSDESRSFWTRVRYTAAIPKHGVFIRAVKTRQLVNGWPFAYRHVEHPCPHITIAFSRWSDMGGLKIEHSQQIIQLSTWGSAWPHPYAVETLQGVVESNGETQEGNPGEPLKQFWGRCHHCPACNTEWMLRTSTDDPALLIFRIYRCLGLGKDIFNSKTLHSNSTTAQYMIRGGYAAPLAAGSCATQFGDLRPGAPLE